MVNFLTSTARINSDWPQIYRSNATSTELAKGNPLDYLTELQKHAKESIQHLLRFQDLIAFRLRLTSLNARAGLQRRFGMSPR
jgi:hypothetical protein